ncbi:Uncharacterised protein [Chryseobacterium nakagawai]|nr:hypothetical protein [Chryseobacterium nakagawai]VEH21616.1 Uncharacterised protein [Chryseobacterium nakagawai]
MNDIRIKMTHYVLIVLMISSIITLVCCKESNKKSEQNITVHTETIRSVKVVSAGGELGFSSSTLINKDSIYYNRTVAANEAENLSYSKKVKPEDWKKLVAAIDHKLFGSAKDGKSVQPVDGIDTKIIVTTSAGAISKMNAYDDPAWKNIRDLAEGYSNSYK